MHAQRSVVITRKSAEEGKPGRVYVTGPHFGSDWKGGIYSSTTDPSQASVYDRERAEAMLALGKWRGLLPEIRKARGERP